MATVKLKLNEQGRGAFLIDEDGLQLGEMVVSVTENTLTVYHTEVDPSAEGKGFAKMLLNEMVAYVRAHQLKVVPLCPYVHAQFKRHPQDFEDIWLKAAEDL